MSLAHRMNFLQDLFQMTAIALLSCEWVVYDGARGVMVIVVGNGHDDTSSNPGPGKLHFT